MLLEKPTHFFLCAGHAEGETPLNAFDNALRDAGVHNVNLIRLSSILPPGVVQTQVVSLPPGAFVPIAYGTIHSAISNEVISAAVATAVPVDPTNPGVIMEYSARGHAEDAERIVRNMAERAMISRGYAVKEILSLAAGHVVQHTGAAFAGVVLYPRARVMGS